MFASDKGMPHFNASLAVNPANIQINFTSPETRMILLSDAEDPKTARSYLHSSEQTPELDG